MNDLEVINFIISNDIASSASSITSAEPLVDWYDYKDIITRQDTIIENQSKTFDLVNQGFTFISFILILFFIYYLIKNMIRK